MSNEKEISIMVDEHLLLVAKDKLDMTMSEFVDYSLRLYLNEESQSSKLFKKGIDLQSDLNKIIGRLNNLQKKHKRKNTDEDFAGAMETVNRIQGVLGYVGKNQLEKIANQNELNANELIRYVQNQKDIVVKNYGELPKVR